MTDLLVRWGNGGFGLGGGGGGWRGIVVMEEMILKYGV